MTSVLTSILEVFSSVGTWIAQAVQDLIPMFYTAENGLTFVGVLAVASLAFSVIFLILYLFPNNGEGKEKSL